MAATKTTDGREERGEQTRNKLLSAATTAFARDGFTKASVRAIAAEAGVHPGLLRYHFGSKDGLWEQVVTQAMDGLRDRLLSELVQGTDPRDRIHRVLDGLLDHLEADPDFPRLILRGAMRGDPVVLGIAERHLRPLWLAAGDDALAQGAMTVYGAAVAPILYQPLLAAVFDADPLDPAARAARRTHLHALVDRLLETP